MDAAKAILSYLLGIDWSMIGYTAAGATMLWARWGRDKMKSFGVADLIGLLPVADAWKHFLEFLVFIGLGAFIAIGLTSPSTPAQAFAAGLGWTGLFGKKA